VPHREAITRRLGRASRRQPSRTRRCSRQRRDAAPTPTGFAEIVVQARVAAGITDWPENALRHSFASYHLAHFKNDYAQNRACVRSGEIPFSTRPASWNARFRSARRSESCKAVRISAQVDFVIARLTKRKDNSKLTDSKFHSPRTNTRAISKCGRH
jgi:hypothetical protein